MKILLDTNFLVLAGKKVDIYELLSGSELLTLDSCIRELEKLAASRKKDAAAARIAMNVMKGRVKIIKTEAKNTDSAILGEAKRHKSLAVATNDRKLIKNLKAHGIRVIRLRQGKMLTEE